MLALQSVERPPKRQRFPPFDPDRGPQPERITRLHTVRRIAAFRCAAPARCGALADERRGVAGDLL